MSYDETTEATFFERAPFKLPPGVKYKCEHRVILLHDSALSCQGCPAVWKAPK